jgi:uncharacterized protein involved in exopolysaccharide biosynthesis
MQDPLKLEKIPERSLRDVYYILFRHKWKIIAFFIAVVTVVTVGMLVSPSIYRSEAKLLIRVGRESVTLDPTASTGQVITNIGQQRETEIKSELEILKSQDLIEKVVDAIGPAAFLKPSEETNGTSQKIGGGIKQWLQPILEGLTSPLKGFIKGLSSQLSDRDQAILGVTKGLEIDVPKTSNIITINFETKSRKLAQETINNLIGFYLDKHINVHNTPGSFEFFTKETDQFRGALAKTEETLKELKNRTGIASLTDQRNILLARIGRLQQESEETESALATSSAKVKAFESSLAQLPKTMVLQETTGNPNQSVDLMRARLYELELKEQDLLSKYTETSKPVQEVRRQLAEAKTLLAKEDPTRKQVTQGLNEAHKQTELTLLSERANRSSLRAKAAEQRIQLASARNDLKAINDSEVSLLQVQREVGIQEANYKKYFDKLEQARIDHALEMVKISNISLVQPATYPVEPIRPKKLLNIALGFFLGIFGGIGLAFVSEYMDHTFKKPEDVTEKLGLPVLASIPNSKK